MTAVTAKVGFDGHSKEKPGLVISLRNNRWPWTSNGGVGHFKLNSSIQPAKQGNATNVLNVLVQNLSNANLNLALQHSSKGHGQC
jgi:hypothetical protein